MCGVSHLDSMDHRTGKLVASGYFRSYSHFRLQSQCKAGSTLLHHGPTSRGYRQYPTVQVKLWHFVNSRKLNYHLYQALKKAMYKPAAFFKGILLPLCEVQKLCLFQLQDECTLKEAIIVSSVVAKVSIPMAHSAAALMKLTQIPSICRSVFIVDILEHLLCS